GLDRRARPKHLGQGRHGGYSTPGLPAGGWSGGGDGRPRAGRSRARLAHGDARLAKRRAKAAAPRRGDPPQSALRPASGEPRPRHGAVTASASWHVRVQDGKGAYSTHAPVKGKRNASNPSP